jgi:hypothetical protein
MHAAQVADELSKREQALRRLPLPFALTRLPWTASTALPKRNSVLRRKLHTATPQVSLTQSTTSRNASPCQAMRIVAIAEPPGRLI